MIPVQSVSDVSMLLIFILLAAAACRQKDHNAKQERNFHFRAQLVTVQIKILYCLRFDGNNARMVKTVDFASRKIKGNAAFGYKCGG